jgi:16S rRNA (uracil1498-N3)-methyltransferase
MPRRRFYISQDRIQDGVAVLTPDQSHHLRNVLRFRDGDPVELFDGKGCGYSGRIEYHGTAVRVLDVQKIELPGSCGPRLVLAAALIKPDRFEWLLQKGTELGVDEFVPLATRFSNAHIQSAKVESRIERWRRIVQEAAKQCRRPTVPDIRIPLPFAAFVSSDAHPPQARFLLHEKADERLKAISAKETSYVLCVGPEGGWEESETAAARDAGFQLIRMGPRILRAETAAVAAVAVFQFLLDE